MRIGKENKKVTNLKELYRRRIENRGITLVALIVTIVVLLILAGVSIGALTNRKGLIQEAHNSADQAQRESIIQKIQADLLVEKTKTGDNPNKNTLKDIIEENGYNEGELGEDSFITKDGGFEIQYDEISGWKNLTVNDLKTGNHVSYTTQSGETIECVVLYDSNYNYGVQIISTDSVDTVLLGSADYTASKTSYNGAIETLNNVARNLLNTNIANDARCVGTNPGSPDIDTDEMFTLGYTHTQNNALKVADSNYETDYNQMTSLGIAGATSEYWLASRTILSYPMNTEFCVRSVTSAGELANGTTEVGYGLCSLGTKELMNGNTNRLGFRPVFILKEVVEITNGNGEKDNPYILDV